MHDNHFDSLRFFERHKRNLDYLPLATLAAAPAIINAITKLIYAFANLFHIFQSMEFGKDSHIQKGGFDVFLSMTLLRRSYYSRSANSKVLAVLLIYDDIIGHVAKKFRSTFSLYIHVYMYMYINIY